METVAISDLCVKCNLEVRPRQHGLACDACGRWQHRRCQSGVDAKTYMNMVKGISNIEWQCWDCAILNEKKSPEKPTPQKECYEDGEKAELDMSIDRTNIPEKPTPQKEPYEEGEKAELDMSIDRSHLANFDLNYSWSQDDQEDDQDNLPEALLVLHDQDDLPEAQLHDQDDLPEAQLHDQDDLPETQLHDQDDLPEAQLHDQDDLPEALLNLSLHQPTYQIAENCSRSGRDQLFDNQGYCFNIKRKVVGGRDWQCSVRKKGCYCKATVAERGGHFTFGKHTHCHEGVPGVIIKKQITAQVKQDALANVFLSAGAIAEKAVYGMADAAGPPGSRPQVSQLIRVANRTREKTRPQEPQALNFELAQGYIPKGFLVADLCEDQDSRHLVFASTEQLDILANVSTWYIDGTFKVAKHPFVQLFSVHGFLGKDTKQVPLAFVLMTRRQTSDYIKVFEAIVNLLPRRAAVQTILADFEKAAWAAIGRTLPGVKVAGCHFHWAQAIWRKVQKCGLQGQYATDRKAYTTIRKVLALPFLPVTEVRAAFEEVKNEAALDDRTQEFLHYVDETWLSSSVYKMESWNVFKKTIRTNNDCEGWHQRLNHSAHDSKPPFYLLLPLLHEEALKIPIQQQQVNDGTLERLCRKPVRDRQAQYAALWASYDHGELSPMQLLVAVSKIKR